MHWSGWDIAVTAVAVLNLGALVVIGVCAWRISTGPVSSLLGNSLGLLPQGMHLAETLQRVWASHSKRLIVLLQHLGSLRKLLRVDAFIPSPEGEPVTLHTMTHLLQTLGTVRLALGSVKQFGGRLFGGKPNPAAATPPGPTAARSTPRRRVSLGERLGLIPPAARHLPTVLRVTRIARSVLQTLRARDSA